MAKVTAPLLSFGAGGAIAKTQVYSKWRGIEYARRYVVPANPKTEAQTETRSVFAFLNAVWKQLAPAAQAPWTLATKGRPLTNRNLLLKQNIAALRGTTADPVTDLSGIITSPGANAGLAAAGIATADDMAHGLTVTLTAPDLPDGWAITAAHFVVFLQQDAKEPTNPTPHYMSDNATPYTATFAAIGAATYEATGFFEFTKPDGTTAFSPSLAHAQVVA